MKLAIPIVSLLALLSGPLISCSLVTLYGVCRCCCRIVIVVELGRDGRKRRIVSLLGRSPQFLCRHRVIQTCRSRSWLSFSYSLVIRLILIQQNAGAPWHRLIAGRVRASLFSDACTGPTRVDNGQNVVVIDIRTSNFFSIGFSRREWGTAKFASRFSIPDIGTLGSTSAPACGWKDMARRVSLPSPSYISAPGDSPKIRSSSQSIG